MGEIYADQIPALAQGDTRNRAVSFASQLGSGASLSTATVTEVTTTDLTISGVAVSVADLTINGTTVSAGEAVQMTIAGQLKTTGSYTLKVTVTTDDGETMVKYVRFQVGA